MASAASSSSRTQLAKFLRTLYINLSGEPVMRERVVGGRAISLKMFAGDPSSKVAYFVGPEGQFAVRPKRGWTWLGRARIVTIGTLSNQEAHRQFELAQAARKRRQRVRIT